MLDIIIPTYNEESSIKRFLKALKKEMRKKKFKAIIVDDSKDKTALVAARTCKELKIPHKIIQRKERKGKGSAVNRGLKELEAEKGVLIDADLEYHPKYILPMLEKLEKYDFLTSIRVRKDPWYRRILGAIFKSYVKLLFNIDFETQSGLKVFRTKTVKNINLTSKGWVFDVELIHKVMKKGFKVGTYKIKYTKRLAGKSKIGVFTPFKMFYNLLRLRLRL